MKKIKVLILIDWFLPGTLAGGPIRSVANMINHLDSGFEFSIITTNTDYKSNDPYINIYPNRWIQHNPNTKVFYFSKANLNPIRLRKIIKSIDHDFIYINGIYSVYFSILPLLFSRGGKVIATRGMLSQQAFASKKNKKLIFVNFAKKIGLYKNCTFQVTSKEELKSIQSILGQDIRVKLLSNLPRKRNAPPNLSLFSSKKKIIYLARISLEKGQHYFLKALKPITSSVIVDLYGPINDEAYWKKCLDIIKTMPSNIEVTYKGTINGQEVPQFLADYHFLALTSEGENFGHSIVEALTEGKPVIISNRTPWQSLAKKKVGWDVLPNETDTLTAAISTALNLTDDEYSTYSSNCINYINNHPLIKEAKTGYGALFTSTY